jgi:hypothetical protein
MSTDPLVCILARDLLIEHLDGRPVALHSPTKDATLGARADMASRRRLVASLIARRFLCTRACADGVGCETVITEAGRAALAEALANWADALCRVSEQPGVLAVPSPALVSLRR